MILDPMTVLLPVPHELGIGPEVRARGLGFRLLEEHVGIGLGPGAAEETRGGWLRGARARGGGAGAVVLAGAVLRAVGSSPRCFGIFCALESGEFSLREAFSSVLSGFWRVLGRVGLETDPSKIVRGMCSSIDDKKCP